MSVTLSHFANLTDLSYGGTAIGSTSNLTLATELKRAEGMSNAVISGNVSSHIVEKHYRWSFDSNDVSAMTFLNTTTNQAALSVLTATWVASQTQLGTPLADQTITLSNCIVDKVGINPDTKAIGKYKIEGHCLATSDDSDQFSIADAA